LYPRVKYFNNMYDHAAQIAEVCRKPARLAYVIGNSKFYEQPLPSDEILASIFEHFGFELEGIERMRRRQSKMGLHKAVVFMRRGRPSIPCLIVHVPFLGPPCLIVHVPFLGPLPFQTALASLAASSR
jgi:hypothetical protein